MQCLIDRLNITYLFVICLVKVNGIDLYKIVDVPSSYQSNIL